MNINNIIYLCKLMDSDSLNQLPTPKEQTYFKLHKPKLALVVDNTKQKKSKVISYDKYMKRKLGDFFEFLFDKADIE